MEKGYNFDVFEQNRYLHIIIKYLFLIYKPNDQKKKSLGGKKNLNLQ